MVVREAEGFALFACGNLTSACFDLATNLAIPSYNFCSFLSEVDTFCGVARSMMNMCHQDCQDEVEAAIGCMLKEGGCSEDQCSPGFKVGVWIPSALGAVVAVWMFMT